MKNGCQIKATVLFLLDKSKKYCIMYHVIQIWSVFMKKSILNSLAECPLFRNISEADLCNIAEEYATIEVCEKNEVIFSENNYTRSLVIIIKGSASVTKQSGNSKILMNIHNKGDIFGMATLFYEEENYLTQITALEKMTMAVFSKENVKKIFSVHPAVSENYITILSEKIHFLNKKITTYTKAETLQKVASFILQHTNDEKTESVLPFSITSISEALNVGRASVYRAFDTLENDSVIKREGKKIIILDLAALENI